MGGGPFEGSIKLDESIVGRYYDIILLVADIDVDVDVFGGGSGRKRMFDIG